MKIFIIGMNSVGKSEVIKDLTSLCNIKEGKRFCSLESAENENYLQHYHFYDNIEVNNMFENKAYFFLNENRNFTKNFYEGISLYEYENYDIFMLSPDQFIQVPKFDKDTIFVWMDGNLQNRRSRYIAERRKYNLTKIDEIEREYSNDFVSKLYTYKNVLYFNNEDPSRISAIIYAIYKDPSLIEVFRNRFN